MSKPIGAIIQCVSVEALESPVTSIRAKCAHCGTAVWLSIETKRRVEKDCAPGARLDCYCEKCLPDQEIQVRPPDKEIDATFAHDPRRN
jgi:hypothetical protein